MITNCTNNTPKLIIKAMDYSFGEILTLTIPYGEPNQPNTIIYDALEQPLQNVSDITLNLRLTEGISELTFVHSQKTRTATIINFKHS